MNTFYRLRRFVKKRKKLSVGALALIIIFSLRAVNNRTLQEEISLEKITEVELLNIGEQQARGNRISATGEIESLDQVQLKSEVLAKVFSVPVSLGEAVYAGQLLVSFNAADLSAQLQQAEAVHEKALASKEQLQAQHQQTLVNVQNAITSAEAAFKTAEINLDVDLDATESQIVLDAYEDAVVKLTSIYSRLGGFMTTADSIVGVDTPLINDAYEIGIRSQNESQFNRARTRYQQIQSIRVLVDDVYDVFQSDPSQQNVDELIAQMNAFFFELEDLFGILVDLLNRTIEASGIDQDTLDGLRSSIETGQTNVTTQHALLVDQRQAINAAKNSVSNTQVAYEKALRNFEDAKTRGEAQIAVSETSVSSQDAEIKRALGSVNAVRASLAKTVIRSPITGVVATLDVKPGELVTTGARVATVMNTSGFQVAVYVSAHERELIAIGSKAYMDESVEGVVTHIAPSIDSLTKKVEVIIALDAADGLVSGQFVDVDIELETNDEHDSIFLPLDSVAIDAQRKAVYVIEDDDVVEKEVLVNRIVGDSIEITSGLEGITDIIASLRGIEVGQQVTVK